MSDYPDAGTLSLNVICFDLDGTLAEDTWPDPHIGKPIPEGIAALQYYYEAGYAIDIWTARPEAHLQAIAFWLGQVAEVLPMIHDIRCGKPKACLYVDDRAWRPPWATPLAPALTQAEKDLAVLNGDDITRMD